MTKDEVFRRGFPRPHAADNETDVLGAGVNPGPPDKQTLLARASLFALVVRPSYIHFKFCAGQLILILVTMATIKLVLLDSF